MSAPPLVTFLYRHAWKSINITRGPAVGGDHIGVIGAGFDAHSYEFTRTTKGEPWQFQKEKTNSGYGYQCLWTGINPESNRANATNVGDAVVVSETLISCRIPAGGKTFSLENTTFSLWYGNLTDGEFTNGVYEVNQVGRELINYNDNGTAIYDGSGHAKKRKAIFTWVCCYPIDVTVDHLYPGYLIQNKSARLRVKSWNLPYTGALINIVNYPNPTIYLVGRVLGETSTAQCHNANHTSQLGIMYKTPVGVGTLKQFQFLLDEYVPPCFPSLFLCLCGSHPSASALCSYLSGMLLYASTPRTYLTTRSRRSLDTASMEKPTTKAGVPASGAKRSRLLVSTLG